jgi:dienelactone hydrolase
VSIPVSVSKPDGAGPFPHDCSGLGPRPTVYPGAHHSFDSDRPVRFVAGRINPSSANGPGATTGGNAAAWQDAIEEVTRFFDRHLSRS